MAEYTRLYSQQKLSIVSPHRTSSKWGQNFTDYTSAVVVSKMFTHWLHNHERFCLVLRLTEVCPDSSSPPCFAAIMHSVPSLCYTFSITVFSSSSSLPPSSTSLPSTSTSNPYLLTFRYLSSPFRIDSLACRKQTLFSGDHSSAPPTKRPLPRIRKTLLHPAHDWRVIAFRKAELLPLSCS